MYKLLLGIGLVISSLSSASISQAQISGDGTVETRVTRNGNRIEITGGTQAGRNLFHSFREFSVPAGFNAFFNNNAQISNIITRVTGGNLSLIEGVIATNNANLILINPNGIIFGRGGSLALGRGSFLGTTAEALIFSDGTVFSATESTKPLLTISIPSGLQINRSPAPIKVEGATLSVASGSSLALIGGNVVIKRVNSGSGENLGVINANIIAQDGLVELGGLSEAGVVEIEANYSSSFPQEITRADVLIENNTSINVMGSGKGNISIKARNVALSGGSVVIAGINSTSTFSDAVGGDIVIDATNKIEVNDSLIGNFILEYGEGKAGDIKITAGSLSVTAGGTIVSATATKTIGEAGNVVINVTRGVELDGHDISDTSNSPFDNLKADLIKGPILETIFDKFPSSIASLVAPDTTGNAGDIIINADSLTLSLGSQISASTFGEGNAGNVNINVRDIVKVDGQRSDLRYSVISSTVGLNIEGVKPGSTVSDFDITGVKGNGGNINITANFVELTNGGVIDANTYVIGNAGNIIINAREKVKIDGFNAIDGDTTNPIQNSKITSYGSGSSASNAGRIEINTHSLEVTNEGGISTDIYGQGSAGSIIISATGRVLIDRMSRFNQFPGVSSTLRRPQAEGNAGEITISAEELVLTNGARINTSTKGKGNAGNIIISVAKNISLGSNALVSSKSFESSSGNSGNITINTAGSMNISDKAAITVESENPSSAGGNITITAKSLNLDNRASISAETSNSTGGNLSFKIQNILQLRQNSQISTTAGTEEGLGNGGNININSQFVLGFPFANSDITANAFQGQGGRIEITSSGIFGFEVRAALTPFNDITAFSELNPALDGEIIFNIPVVDSTYGLIQLPEIVIDPSALIAQNPCLLGKDSQFIVTGKGGLPPSPSTPQTQETAKVIWLEPAVTSSTQTESVNIESNTPPTTQEIQPAKGWIVNQQGEVELVAFNPTGTNSRQNELTPSYCTKK